MGKWFKLAFPSVVFTSEQSIDDVANDMLTSAKAALVSTQICKPNWLDKKPLGSNFEIELSMRVRKLGE